MNNLYRRYHTCINHVRVMIDQRYFNTQKTYHGDFLLLSKIGKKRTTAWIQKERCFGLLERMVIRYDCKLGGNMSRTKLTMTSTQLLMKKNGGKKGYKPRACSYSYGETYPSCHGSKNTYVKPIKGSHDTRGKIFDPWLSIKSIAVFSVQQFTFLCQDVLVNKNYIYWLYGYKIPHMN